MVAVLGVSSAASSGALNDQKISFGFPLRLSHENREPETSPVIKMPTKPHRDGISVSQIKDLPVPGTNLWTAVSFILHLPAGF
jgi:hypothetical protein